MNTELQQIEALLARKGEKELVIPHVLPLTHSTCVEIWSEDHRFDANNELACSFGPSELVLTADAKAQRTSATAKLLHCRSGYNLYDAHHSIKSSPKRRIFERKITNLIIKRTNGIIISFALKESSTRSTKR